MRRRGFFAMLVAAATAVFPKGAKAQAESGRLFAATAILGLADGGIRVIGSWELGPIKGGTWADAARITAGTARNIADVELQSMTITMDVQPEPLGL